MLARHLHPAVRQRGKGEQPSLPCFFFGATMACCLPSVISLAFQPYGRRKDDVVFVVIDDAVIRFDLRLSRYTI